MNHWSLFLTVVDGDRTLHINNTGIDKENLLLYLQKLIVELNGGIPTTIKALPRKKRLRYV